MEKENVLLKQFEHVVNEIKKDRFSSHDFIGKYTQLYEREWKSFLNRYETKAAQKTHAYLSRMLSMYVKKNLIRLIKETKMNKSKNIHAKHSNVTWWQKVASCIVLLMLFPTLMVAQDLDDYLDDKYKKKARSEEERGHYERRTPNIFKEQLDGWEWTFSERSTEEHIKTPYLDVTYRKYASHPQYHVLFNKSRKINIGTIEVEIPKAVYDTQGNLLRIIYFWPGKIWYDEVLAFKKTRDSILAVTNPMVNELSAMIANSKKLSKSVSIIPDITFLSVNYNVPRAAPFPSEYGHYRSYCIGLRVGRVECGRTDPTKVVKDLNKLIKENPLIKIEPWLDEQRTSSGSTRRVVWLDYEPFSMRTLFDSIIKQEADNLLYLTNMRYYDYYTTVFCEDPICVKEMIIDYKNNKYDVWNKESAETCKWIEYQLGLRDKQTVQGIKSEDKNNALYYLRYLENEYWYSYTSIKRIDALSFQATIKVEPNNTIYNVIVRYKSDGPYKYTYSYELMP